MQEKDEMDKDIEFDVLTEIGNIGAGNATTSSATTKWVSSDATVWASPLFWTFSQVPSSPLPESSKEENPL